MFGFGRKGQGSAGSIMLTFGLQCSASDWFWLFDVQAFGGCSEVWCSIFGWWTQVKPFEVWSVQVRYFGFVPPLKKGTFCHFHRVREYSNFFYWLATFMLFFVTGTIVWSRDLWPLLNKTSGDSFQDDSINLELKVFAFIWMTFVRRVVLLCGQGNLTLSLPDFLEGVPMNGNST